MFHEKLIAYLRLEVVHGFVVRWSLPAGKLEESQGMLITGLNGKTAAQEVLGWRTGVLG